MDELIFFPGKSYSDFPGNIEERSFVNKTLIITHYYHSGFSVADKNVLLVFDYWRGEEGERVCGPHQSVEHLHEAAASLHALHHGGALSAAPRP